MNEHGIRNSRVLVLGLGKSGIAACRLCHQQGASVVGMDRKAAGELNGETENLRDELPETAKEMKGLLEKYSKQALGNR